MQSRHEILIRIKRAVLAGRYSFSEKARNELKLDGLTELDVAEAIIYAPAINKTIRSRSPFRDESRELLYVILGSTLEGRMIYTKGKLRREEGRDFFYFLFSSKYSREREG